MSSSPVRLREKKLYPAGLKTRIQKYRNALIINVCMLVTMTIENETKMLTVLGQMDYQATAVYLSLRAP